MAFYFKQINKIDINYVIIVLHMLLKNRFLKKISIFCLCLFASSCATVSVYNIDLRYEPTKHITKSDINIEKITFTITSFNDLREVENRIIIGKVIDSKGKEVPIATIKEKPAHAVTLAFRDAFYKAGLSISDIIPQWDLKEGSLKSEWGSIVIGGEVFKLEILVKDGIAMKHYETNIKLRLTIGDSRTSKIFYIPSYEATNRVTDITFSEEKAQKYLNSSLSALIERIISDYELWNKIEKQFTQKADINR